jgi:hypothetical protein
MKPGPGINACSGSAWVTGVLSAPHAAYRAGDFVPMRMILRELEADTTYTLEINYGAVDHGLHAYDYLGSVDASKYPGQDIVPCSGVGDTAGIHSCSSNNPSTLGVPPDEPNVPPGNPGTTFPPGGSQLSGDFSAWGATLTHLAYFHCSTCGAIGPNPPANAHIDRQIDVTFRTPLDGHTAVLAWGAHIASPLDWGLGRTTAGQRSGADMAVDFGYIRTSAGSENLGGHTLKLKPDDIAPPPGLTTQVSATSATTDETVTDTATLTAVGGNPVRGSVQFFVCFNGTEPPTPPTPPDCSRNGTPLGPPKVVNRDPPPSGPNGTQSVGFRADDLSGGGEGPGTYCFRVEFRPDTPDYSPTLHTNTSTSGVGAECFVATGPPEPPPERPTLEIKKVCVPPGNGHFRILIETADGQHMRRRVVGCGGTTGAIPLPPGDYRVRERGANGTNLADYTSLIDGDCASDGTITVAAGSYECQITNVHKGTPPPAQITVTKICVPPGDGGRFNLTIDGQTSPDVTCGRSFGPVPVAAGQHHVSETAGTGTSLTDYTTSIGGACAADGSITLTAGQQATCTITNVRNAIGPPPTETGTIEIQKQCSPAGTRGRFDLELDQLVFRGIACGQSTGPVVIGVGDHRVGEVAVAGITSRFTTTVSGGCSASGSFTLSAGQHITCVITNTLAPLRPGPRPPLACYRLTVVRRMVRAGNLVPIVARVSLHGRPVPGVRVFAVGHRVSAVLTTGPNGRVVFLLRLHRPGILRLKIRTPFECPAHPPQKIGVLGATQPSLTG